MKLVYTATGEEVKVGDTAKTFRNEECTVTSMAEPHKPGSTGRVRVTLDGYACEFYPSVINAEWRED